MSGRGRNTVRLSRASLAERAPWRPVETPPIRMNPGDTPGERDGFWRNRVNWVQFTSRRESGSDNTGVTQVRPCGCVAVVAHHLAKVRVASSNLVIRSRCLSSLEDSNSPEEVSHRSGTTPDVDLDGGVAERRGSGLQSRPRVFESRPHLHSAPAELIWAIGAAVARFPDTEEVTGSIPVSPTERRPPELRGFSCFIRCYEGLRSEHVARSWHDPRKAVPPPRRGRCHLGRLVGDRRHRRVRNRSG